MSEKMRWSDGVKKEMERWSEKGDGVMECKMSYPTFTKLNLSSRN